jgi:hypothetical protein
MDYEPRERILADFWLLRTVAPIEALALSMNELLISTIPQSGRPSFKVKFFLPALLKFPWATHLLS